MSWEPVIGLELHAQLSTNSKLFSGASTAYGAQPNTQACAVDLALPGVLPVLNAEVVRMAALFGLATHATVARRCVFARKNYFYPDLPKGYQISQYELPIVHDGWLEIEDEQGQALRIGITRAHLEEDAGKSVHDAYQGMSGIDLNRAGTPLIEIVSEPDMRSARQAVAYMRKVHAIVRYLGICDGNMQEGSFRCDANVSVRRSGDQQLGTRTEIKNLNSFRYVERAINHEIERQIDLLESGQTVVQETRLYDAGKDQTRAMRSKEEANDYRYFPDPDLLPVEISQDYIESLRMTLPELPDHKRQRFMDAHGLRSEDAAILTESPDLAEYYESAVGASQAPAKLVANWVLVNLLGNLNKAELEVRQSPVSPAALGRLVTRIEDGTISGNIAKQVFEALWQSEDELDPDQVIEAQGLRQMTDSGEIEKLVDEIVAASPAQVEQYRSGKDKVFGYFVGQVMKATKGKANPQQVNELLRARLKAD